MGVTILYEGQPMDEEPDVCQYTDNADGRCDTLLLGFYDSNDRLKGLSLKKGAEVQALHVGIDTGAMYVSEIRRAGRMVSIKALSTRPGLKAASSASWDRVSFYELITSVARETGLEVKLLNPIDAQYETVTRINQPPVQFLQSRLALEGFCCKVRDNAIIIYNERIQEKKAYIQQLKDGDFDGSPEYETNDASLAAACVNSYETAEGALIRTRIESGLPGRILSENIVVSTIGESERYCRGILRQANKYEYTASGEILGGNYEAGQTVYLADAPDGHAGLNYLYRVTSNFILDVQTLDMRRPIQGDY